MYSGLRLIQSHLIRQPLWLSQNIYEVENAGCYNQTSVNTTTIGGDLLH